MLTSTLITDRATWNDHLRPLPGAHFLQTWEWGALKQRTTGWQPERFLYYRADAPGGAPVAAAQVLTRRVGPLGVMYVPKGPVLDATDPALLAGVLDHLQGLARRRGAIWLKIDPDIVVGTGVPNGDESEPPAVDDPIGQAVVAALTARGWRFSASQVQFRNTVTLDLTQPTDDILMGMRQSTRRKVRTAAKKDVTIRPGSLAADMPALYGLYATTGARDGFLTRPPDYYRDAWGSFIEAGMAQPFLAEYEGRAIAHVLIMHFGRKAWYYIGASSNEERQRMPNYALQWAAIQWAQDQGYTTYDFWGAPDDFTEDDRMWGVYQFKKGFGGTVVRHLGAWDYVPYPPLYWAYETLMPRVLNRLRRRGNTPQIDA